MPKAGESIPEPITSQDTDSTGVGGGSGKIAGCGRYSGGISGILHQGNGGSGDVVVKRQALHF